MRVEQRAGEPGGVDDRHHLGRLVGGEEVRLVVAHVAVPGELGLQPLCALWRAGQLDPAGEVQPGALAALLLDGAVHADRVGLQAGDDGVGVDGVEAAGGVPAGAGGELPRSISATSVSPRSVRWYRMLQPTIPPPMTTTRYWSFIAVSRLGELAVQLDVAVTREEAELEVDPGVLTLNDERLVVVVEPALDGADQLGHGHPDERVRP